jgi:hypothetical protein
VRLEELVQTGVSRGSVHRTLRTLEFLGLVDEEGRWTPAFRDIAAADADRYRAALGAVLRNAYGPIFDMMDATEMSERALRAAFRGFVPEAQRDRMIGLFQALSREAGIIPGGPVRQTPRRQSTAPAASEGWFTQRDLAPANDSKSKLLTEWLTAPHYGSNQTGNPPSAWTAPWSAFTLSELRKLKPEHLFIEALLRQLPADGLWTARRRQQWLKAVEGAVDLLIEVVDERDSNSRSSKIQEEDDMT